VLPKTPRHFRDHTIDQFFEAPRRGHSRKPEIAYEIIERAVEGPYLEMFARHPVERPGWSYCGDQAAIGFV
jgi:N6-adenosine-specific RNA methylase IME4